MAYAIYPDAATAAELGRPAFAPIALANGEAIGFFVPVGAMVGPDLARGDEPTTFLRIALNGATISRDAHPGFQLAAHAPDPAPPVSIDPRVSVDRASAIVLSNSSGAPVATAHFVPPYTDNVYFIKIAIRAPVTRLWLRIENTTGLRRDLVWVVADNPTETLQPWVHATYQGSPFINIDLSASAGGTASSNYVFVTNFGTGATIIRRASQPVAPPFSLQLSQETLPPNPQVTIRLVLSFAAPVQPSRFEPVTCNLVTDAKVDTGPFGSGHNIRLTYSGRTVNPTQGRVPDVIGMDFPDAIQVIRAEGFLPRVLVRNGPGSLGVCVDQRPSANVLEDFRERVRAYVTDPNTVGLRVLHDDEYDTDVFLPGD